jgi:hypothetical protein
MPNRSHPSRFFVLLAPALASVPPVFTRPELNPEEYTTSLAKLQRLRGRIYLEDNAIESWQLTEDGRHWLAADESSWHLLTMEEGQVLGCARLQVYAPTIAFSQLGVAQSSQSQCAAWGSSLRGSVNAELHRAQTEQLRFIEAGGWALASELRCTTEALHIALGSYAIGDLLGGSLGLSTATVRHNSASILRRLGATALVWDGQELPRYYDPAYRCEMEVVRFDSRQPNPRYQILINQIKQELTAARVICATNEPEPTSQSLLSLANAVKARAAQKGWQPDSASASYSQSEKV